MRRAWALLGLVPALALADRNDLRVEYYAIAGSTAGQLRAELNAKGPVGEETGIRGDGYTHYHIAWQYDLNGSRGACTAGNVRVDLTVTMTLPRWDTPAGASAGLARVWQDFSGALRLHEDGHAALAREAADRVRQRLSATAHAANCEALRAQLNQLADATLAEYRVKQADYDRRTDSGRTQGTRVL